MQYEDLLWDHIVIGMPNRLRASRCTTCRRVEFPATARCPACSGSITPVPLSGRARLGPCTAVLHPPPGALVEVPYVVGVAEFVEGISVLGLVDTADLGSVSVGDPVDTVVVEVAPGVVSYAFRPAPT